jgi:undecaprenyl-diphosphatase
MTLLDATILGVVQGLTEFLPVSSTAHLKVAEALLQIPRGDPFLTSFDVVIQLGTWVSVLLYFRSRLARMFAGALRGLLDGKPLETSDGRLLWWVLIGSLPVGILGLLFEKRIARLDEDQHTLLLVIAANLVLFGLVLAAAEVRARQQRDLAAVNWVDALVIGFGQSLAIVPGVSRSGVTLAAGLFRGIRRDDAARFSFLLSLPAVGAAGVLKLVKLIRHHELGLGGDRVVLLAWGTLVSGVVGYLVIAWLLRFLQTRRTTPFVVWRLLVGAGLAFWA